ncbi:MAG TPA: phosphoribosylanthranilate isomerase [Gemmatimonadales bacterium]|nr:phosphoribosylanthranilate isomerase [Gemmatimonadales bacterium]
MTAKIKFCGIMQAQDAACASTAGAAYLGVVFAGGPRAVTVEAARDVVAAAGGLPVLGIFANQSPEEILRICDRAGLRGAQLHGTYSFEAAAWLQTHGLEVWRVVRIAVPSDLDTVGDAAAGSHAVLVEPSVPHARGGAGVSLNAALACEARRRLAGHPMVLAGGLTPENVGQALARVRPEIVDVSSGVERLPGIKDPERIARFVEAVFAHSSVP